MNDFHKRYDKDLIVPFPGSGELKLHVVQRRNKKLLDFFSDIGMDVCWIGDPQKPKIIVNTYYQLSAYVKGFDLHFKDAPYQGQIVQTYKLRDGAKISRNEFLKFFNNYEHRRVYKIKYADTDLFLAGYNFKDRNTSTGRYPVFSRVNFKIYTSEDRMNEIIDQFQDYPLNIE